LAVSLNPVKYLMSNSDTPVRVSLGGRLAGQAWRMRIELRGRRPFLRRETLVHRHEDPGVLVLDARELLFASPLELAATVALAHTAATQGIGTEFLAPTDSNVASYVERMDVLRRMPHSAQVRGGADPVTRFDRSQKLVEVIHLTAANAQELIDRMGRLVHDLDSAIRGRAFQSVGELIDNAISHGSSPVGAFAAAQIYTGATTGGRGMEFAICDTGVGVLDHLRGNPKHEDLTGATAALERALQPGVTGTNEKRGNGLYDLFKISQLGRYSRLVLRSGDGIASIVAREDERRSTYVATADPIIGTWAWLRLRNP
jgi:hypothetical protein